MSALTLLMTAAQNFGIEVIDSGSGTARARVPLPRPSGTTVEYELELAELRGGHVQVREVPTRHRLPVCCPERHINRDGSFCLYWAEGEDEARPVRDADTAIDWWTLLLRYLGVQETAQCLRRWFGEARAHGMAARHQKRAEEIATSFGPRFRRDLRNARLSTSRRQRHGRVTVQLFRGETLLARVAPTATGAIATDVHCPCDASGGLVRIGTCGSHASDLKVFMMALDEWQHLEQKFYEQLRDQRVRCCGTMQTCPLRH